MRSRIATATVLVAVAALAAAASTSLPVIALVALVAGVAIGEFARFGSPRIAPALILLAFPFYFAWLYVELIPWAAQVQLFALMVFGALCAYSYVLRPNRLLSECGALWILAPLASAVLLQRFGPSDPLFSLSRPIFLAIVPLWVGDTLAYLVGKRWGRTPLMPSVSPKKTLEGAIANLLGCLGAASIIGPAVGVDLLPSLFCGTIAGTLGQAGDLFESAMKRRVGVKDSGGLLPGHGGVLDRIDSLLMCMPAQALIISLSLATQR